MPRKQTVERARAAKRGGKAPTTQAGEFVREEMEKMEEGGARAPRSRKQAIAIGLSQARRSGVDVPERGAKKTRGRKAGARKTSSRKATARKASSKASTRKASTRTSTKRASGRKRTRKATRKTSSRKRTSTKRASR